MRNAAPIVVALALAGVLAGAAMPVEPRSGLRGVVMRGPTSAVCSDGDACAAPAVGLVLRFSRAGTVAARATTTTGGRYLVSLRPGTYAVTTRVQRPGVALTPRSVRVPEGRRAHIDFYLDTGIQ